MMITHLSWEICDWDATSDPAFILGVTPLTRVRRSPAELRCCRFLLLFWLHVTERTRSGLDLS